MDFDSLLSGSIVFLYFWACLSILNYSMLSKKQKIAIMYVFTYGITIKGLNPIWVYLASMIGALFVYEEYMNVDQMKIKLIKRLRYKCIDFAYQYIFCYKLIFVFVAFCFRTPMVLATLNRSFKCFHISFDEYPCGVAVSFLILILAIHLMLTDTVELNDFTKMYQMVSKYPMYKVKLTSSKDREELRKRLDLICELEDRTFFKRTKSYSSFSIEYVKVQLKEHYRIKGKMDKEKDGIRLLLKKWWNLDRKKKVTFIKKAFHIIGSLFSKKVKSFAMKVIRLLKRIIRGHSTIEMQTIRILSYKTGLVFKNSKTKYKYWKILKRKLYEVIYSKLFFVGLYDYYKEECVGNLDYFRYYIVYLYLHTVQSSVFGVKYTPIATAFKGQDNRIQEMQKWQMDKLFVLGLGLTGGPIDKERLENNRRAIEVIGLDFNPLLKMCEEKNINSLE